MFKYRKLHTAKEAVLWSLIYVALVFIDRTIVDNVALTKNCFLEKYLHKGKQHNKAEHPIMNRNLH